jgi:hypothetical protein
VSFISGVGDRRSSIRVNEGEPYSPSSSTMTERERYFGCFIFIARDQVPLALIPVNPLCPCRLLAAKPR